MESGLNVMEGFFFGFQKKKKVTCSLHNQA